MSVITKGHVELERDDTSPKRETGFSDALGFFERPCIHMTPKVERCFALLRQKYGDNCLQRVENMVNELSSGRQDRDPMQAGAKWVLPRLASKPWHDPLEYRELGHIVSALESLHAPIRTEIDDVISRDQYSLEKYAHYRGTQKGWRALYVFRDGRPVDENRTKVPTVFKFMEETLRDWLCPLLELHFSILQPGARIPLHCDLWNFSICLHLAVDIPPDCHLRVAGIEHKWTEGKCILFDYSYYHEAWNDSDRPRICLLMDLWHPNLTPVERTALTTLVHEIRSLLG